MCNIIFTCFHNKLKHDLLFIFDLLDEFAFPVAGSIFVKAQGYFELLTAFQTVIIILHFKVSFICIFICKHPLAPAPEQGIKT